jgi:hypothetical protein
MVSNPIFYNLLLLSLVWLCIMLHVLWPYERTGPDERMPTGG